MTSNTYDIAVIGAGIAGASVAAMLSEDASVLLIERESQPGYHSTGRSAAMFIPSYGPAAIQSLTKASAAFFNHPPQTFCDTPLLQPRAEMLIARKDQLHTVDKFISESAGNSAIQRITSDEAMQHCPLLKHGYAAAGVLDTSGSDIDVHTLHQGYLRTFKRLGGTLITNSAVQSLSESAGSWQVQTTSATITAGIIVNAAGAWADELGQLAKAEPIGLIPKRRTALIVKAPEIENFDSIPLVADIDETFYLKPDAGRLLLSPANADPMPPCDVQPEELDIANCISQIENAFDFKVDSIMRKWAGLRSFVKDNSPVAGYSEQANNFFWLAGQGGYGIQSSPALARYAAALVLHQRIPDDLQQHGLNENTLSVTRLTRS